MYGLPPDFDPHTLVGRRAEGVLFTENQVVFIFDADTKLILEGSFAHVAGNQRHDFEVPVLAPTFLKLLGKNVAVAEGAKDGTLKLSFPDQQQLIVWNDSPQYESYQIVLKDRVIIV